MLHIAEVSYNKFPRETIPSFYAKKTEIKMIVFIQE